MGGGGAPRSTGLSSLWQATAPHSRAARPTVEIRGERADENRRLAVMGTRVLAARHAGCQPP